MIIRLSGIRKSFPDGETRINHVLREVNMTVDRGEFVAVRGASGSGKTTLLSILGTLLSPDDGSYLLDGRDMACEGVDHSSTRNRQIGFVFQDHRLMPQYTSLENILLPTVARKDKPLPEEVAHARHLMALTGITGAANRYPRTLSGGEASRVALCRALVMKPLLVLADEPTGQLDAENAANIASLLAELNHNTGTTIIMVTHSEPVSSTAHRMLTLNKGYLL